MGDIFSSLFGDSGSGSLFGNLGNIFTGLMGSNQSHDLQGMINNAYSFSNSRPAYTQMLNQLMSDPSMVTKLPGYQFGMDQTTNAVQKAMAAQGMSGSGTEAATIANSAQSYAGNQFNSYMQQLMQLAGVGLNPADMIKLTQSNQQSQQNSTGGLLGSIGGLIGGIGSIFGF